MTRIVTVPFRNDDEDLWNYIENVTGKPVNGTKIRDMLYAYMDIQERAAETR